MKGSLNHQNSKISNSTRQNDLNQYLDQHTTIVNTPVQNAWETMGKQSINQIEPKVFSEFGIDKYEK